MSDPSFSLSASSVSPLDGKGRRAVPLCILQGFQRGSLTRRSSWNHTQGHNDFFSRWSEEACLQLNNLCSLSLLFVSVLSAFTPSFPSSLVARCRQRTNVMTPDEMPSYICELLFPWRQRRHRLGAAAWRCVQACAFHLSTTIWVPPPAACAGRDAVTATPHLLRFAHVLSPSSHPSSITMTTRCLVCKPASPQQTQRCQSPAEPCPARKGGKRRQHTPRCLLLPARPPLVSSRMRWRCCWRRRRSSSGHWRWLTGSRKRVGSAAAARWLHSWRPEKLFASWTLTVEALGRWAVTDPRRPSYSAPAYHTETWAKPANERTRFNTWHD